MAAIEAEFIGWLPLGDGACLHVGDPDALVIDVVGVADWELAINGQSLFPIEPLR